MKKISRTQIQKQIGLGTWLMSMMFVSIFSACSYPLQKAGVYKSSKADFTDSEIQDSELNFANIKKAILDSQCLECHSVAGGNKGGVNLESYSSVVNALKEIKADIEDGSMPKGDRHLTDQEKKLILTWISKGAPQNSGDVVPTLDIEKSESNTQNNDKTNSGPSTETQFQKIYSYESVFKQVIQPSCLKCHNQKNAAGGVILETYADIQKFKEDIAADILDGSMPRKNTLRSELKDLILAWLKMGMPLMEAAKDSQKEDEPVGPAEDPLKPVTVPESAVMKEIVARGKYLFELSSCNACHTEDRNQSLAGGHGIKSPFGTFYAPNITPDKKTGIGRWTQADFLKAMREGKSPLNRYYYPVFPFTNYSKLTDEDILSIYSYLMTLKPIEKENKKHEMSFPFDQRYLLAFWRPLYFPEIKKQDPSNYFLAKGPYKTIVEKDLEWNRGAYLVEGTLHCAVCHTPRNHLGGLKVNQWMAGSDISGGQVPAPNITPDPETGLKAWTFKDWDLFLTTGQKPDGDFTGGEMKKLVREAALKLTPADKAAVIHYLMSLEPVKSKSKK